MAGIQKQKVVVDTNVLFDFFAGKELVQKQLQSIGQANICFSVITVAEAYAVSSKSDFDRARLFFRGFNILSLNEDISKVFQELVVAHRSRSRWIPDALIAATAIQNGYRLYTLNRKDFDFVEGLNLYNLVLT